MGRPQTTFKNTIGSLPATTANRREKIYLVTDALTEGDIATGGGSIWALLAHDGSAWQWLSQVYSHPNHTGDVTSTGDGATVVAAISNDVTVSGDLTANVIVAPEDRIRLWPTMGWANTLNTATLTTPVTALQYWAFADGGAVERIELTMPCPDNWAGRDLDYVEFDWATDGTNTGNVIVQWVVYTYVAGSAGVNLASGIGTLISNNGTTATVTGSGTANLITRAAIPNLGTGHTITAGTDQLRFMFQRRSSDGGDTCTDEFRVYGWRVGVV